MAVLRPAAAGIDIHSDMHMVCVPAGRVPGSVADRDGLPANVRRFGANTCDLVAVADWLAACGVTTVAMESTGVYWVPLFELLEARGFEVWLVEPGQLSRCGARPKTDVLDCQWIQRLHAYGLLEPSFRPPDACQHQVSGSGRANNNQKTGSLELTGHGFIAQKTHRPPGPPSA